MKKAILLFAALLAPLFAARSQVIIVNDNLLTGRMSEIRAAVVDSLTNEPVPFASVYVIPSKDTTITNFTLSDAEGIAKLDEVPYGSYVFHVEMLGYKPFVKERYFRDRNVDMGTIRLETDEQYLQAAVVTDIGNPIVVKQDTVEFNASSFRVGANAMLKDLLKRMPGMEITDEGTVKFNGQAIDKLTVGGRTFFFGDQSTALNNLPAAVVDKIRVIDRESESTRSTGIQDGNREKVLDVGLKKEYEKGWFGNAGIKGGTTLSGDDDLRDDRGLLYSANALVSAYSEKDQVTLIGNAQNVNDTGMTIVMVGSNGRRRTSNPGVSSAAQLGLNVNTSRIRDVETTVGANYKYSDSDSGSRTSRTTYQEGGDLISATEDSGKQYMNSIGENLEFKKETGKVWFHVLQNIGYDNSDTRSAGKSETRRDGTLVNRSENVSRSLNTTRSSSLDTDVTFRDMMGKKGRSLTLSLGGSYSDDSSTSEESSLISFSGIDENRALQYVSAGDSYSAEGGFRYTEPLGDKWTFSTAAHLNFSYKDNVRNAFDAGGANDYYSSESRNNYLMQQYDLTAQYKFGKRSWLTLGAMMAGAMNETYSKSYGVEATTGAGEWSWYVAPTARLTHTQDNDRLSVSVSGYSRKPSGSRMLPVLNIADPSRPDIGNIYLKPGGYTYMFTNWTRNNREKFTTLMIYFSGYLQTNPETQAQWYDSNGILYSVPINAGKPMLTSSLSINYTAPLDSKKLWSLSVGVSAGAYSSTSYQASGTLPGVDKDTFDYSSFMSGFWGSAGGDRFYSGASGFREGSTISATPSGRVNVKYNQERYSLSVGTSVMGQFSRYSLNPDFNRNTLDTRFTVLGQYTTRHNYELESDLAYVMYHGYADGFGKPEWHWNASVTKSIGAFNLSVTVHDILNQARTLSHDATANYVEDTYRLVMGRYVLFGVKWNFGKMNAVHNQRAQNAAWNLVW